jgi:hypothetical protein
VKLSEAIRAALPLGIPQTKGTFFELDEEGRLCACAGGQALIGAGIVDIDTARELVKRFELYYDMHEHVVRNYVPRGWTDRIFHHPDCSNRKAHAVALAVHFNDRAGASLEQIADELESCGA